MPPRAIMAKEMGEDMFPCGGESGGRRRGPGEGRRKRKDKHAMTIGLLK